MKNIICTTVKAFSACALLGASCLLAQFGHVLVATVPFDFAVSNQHFAAGTYSVTTDLVQGAVLVRGEDNGSAKIALTHAAQAGKTQAQAKLIFNRYGERYFLHRVWRPGTDVGCELTPSKAEQEMARNIGKPEVVSLLVSVPGLHNPGR